MNNSQSAGFQAGEAKGQAQEKGNQLMDKAGAAAQSAKESVQEAGAQMQMKASDATEAVKDATGMNKST
ncbi:stress-induced protein KIN2 [Lactuca sativa]|uniref:stress-induced protein KIN2 n=1 Tax=Lactuca sativa TaxID=4236 RepID=UPI000CC56436|nr:stress-induced protein KIN2 [Lactuca sativa]